MNQLLQQRRYFETWEEAFRGLIPAVRQQSVRVASYTQVLYLQACQMGFGLRHPGGELRMQATYGDLAYKCGMYHQLGKALLPQEYQVYEPTFTKEEVALYRTYTTEGRQLVAELQVLGTNTKRPPGEEEPPTDNIPWLMLRESCQQHNERFDGTGYPDGRAGNDISPIAQIVGMAKTFDHYSAGVKSENPFSDACDAVVQAAGTAFSPELCEVFKASRSKLQSTYNKYIHYTKKIPRTIPLVKKTKGRPMGLAYHAMVGGPQSQVTAFEAAPWFSVNAGEVEELSAVAPRLARTGLTVDVAFYLLYEAADTLLRMQNCQLQAKYLLLQMFPEFYSKESHLKRFEELFSNQPVERAHLLLTLPQERLLKSNKGELEVLTRYLKNGIALLLDDYDPQNISPTRLKELGIAHVRLAPQISAQPQYAADVQALRALDITVFATATAPEQLGWLAECGVHAVRTPWSNDPMDEDTLIQSSLLREREATV